MSCRRQREKSCRVPNRAKKAEKQDREESEVLRTQTQRRKLGQSYGPGPEDKSLPDAQLGTRRGRVRHSIPNAEDMVLLGPRAGE